MNNFKNWFDELGVSRDEFLDDGVVLYDDISRGFSERGATYLVEQVAEETLRITPADVDVPSVVLDSKSKALDFLNELYDGDIHGYESFRHNMEREN